MKSKRTIKGGSWVLAVLLLLVGCTNEITQPGARSDGKARVSFDTPGIAQEVMTRASLAENTTVRVVAYRAGETTYCGSQAYYTDADGKLKPCTVNDDGSFKAVDTQNELALPPDSYDFYAYTPALPLSADYKSVTVPNGVDYASSVKTGVSVTTDMTLTLTELSRKCSKIALVVKKADENTAMTALSVTSGGVTISALATSQNVALNKDITPAAGTTTLNVPVTAFTLAGTTSTAFTYLLPRLGTDRMKIDYNLTYTVSGTTETKPVSGTMGNIVLEKGKSYTFTLTMRKTGVSLSVTDWIESNQEVVTGESLDYTDNGEPWFLIAARDAKNPVNNGTEAMNWYQANGVVDATNPDGKKACPDGWRVPTREDIMLMWIYKNGIINSNLVENNYWSSTISSEANAFFLRMTNGYIAGKPVDADENNKTNLYYIRCVRDVSAITKKYPYSINGKIIVSRDESGGLNKGSLHTDWQISPAHDERQSDNALSASFEVAKDDCNSTNSIILEKESYTWTEATSVCSAYSENGVSWRLPTQRELMSISVMYNSGYLKGITAFKTSLDYWTSTHQKQGYNSWRFSFADNRMTTALIASQFFVRCVRDVDLTVTSSTFTADYAQWNNSFSTNVTFNSMSGSVSVKSIDNSGADKNWLTSAVVSGSSTNGHIQITYKPTAGNAGVHNDVTITLVNQAGTTRTITVKYDNGFIPSSALSANGWTTTLPTNGIQIAKKGNKLPLETADPSPSNSELNAWGLATAVPGAQQSGIGKGYANTSAIITAQGTATAANKCRILNGGDWYLSSRDELIAIQKVHKSYLGASYTLENSNFWSSTDSSDSAQAWMVHMWDGTQSQGKKTDQSRVRCVRNVN